MKRFKTQPGIYLLIIKSPNETYKYVGQSINISNRLIQHKSKLKSNKHHNSRLQNVYNKYCNSFNDVIFKVMYCDKHFLNILEQTYINITQCRNCVCLNVGKSPAHYMSKEHRAYLSSNMKASPAVQASVKKAQEANRGKKHSQERKDNHSIIMKEWGQSPKGKAFKKKMSELTKDRLKKLKKTEDYWVKRKAVGKGNLGNKYALGSKGNPDLALYVFQHKKSKEIFTLTRVELTARIQNVRLNKPKPRLSNLISGKEKSAYGYKLLSCPLHK